jgi:hypothetical protein
MVEIPEEDLKIFKKYSKEQVLRYFLKEESLRQSKKDLFFVIVALILGSVVISIFFLHKYFYNSINYYITLIFFIPLILVFSIMILGHYYGRTTKYQIGLSSGILLITSLFELIYIYISSVRFNILVFIILSSMGVFTGFSFETFLKVFINETDGGKSENFNIEILSHTDTDNLESYEELLKIYINKIINLKNLPSYYSKNEKIFQKVGLDDTFLLYVISKNIFAFFIFMKKGRYIYQGKKSIELQKRISFLLKNSLNFKDANEEHRIESKERCIDILSQYEINNLTIFIGTHKKGTVGLIFVVAIAFIVYTTYPLEIILQWIKTIINNTIVPQIITLLVTAIFFWFLGKQNQM